MQMSTVYLLTTDSESWTTYSYDPEKFPLDSMGKRQLYDPQLTPSFNLLSEPTFLLVCGI